MDKELAQDILANVEEVRLNFLIGVERVLKSDDGKWVFVQTQKWEDVHTMLQLQTDMLESFARQYLES